MRRPSWFVVALAGQTAAVVGFGIARGQPARHRLPARLVAPGLAGPGGAPPLAAAPGDARSP